MKTETQIEVALIDATRVIQTLQHLNPEALNDKINPRGSKPKDNQEQRTVSDCLESIIQTLKELS